MKSISELLNNLHSLDVKIWVDNNTIRYNAPKETLTPALLNQLRERKTEILEFLQNSHVPPILPVNRDRNLPLSFAQQRLWFLEQLKPNSSIYCLPTVYRLTGSLNVTALEQSLHELVQRHEILRTTFLAVDGLPIQVISQETVLTFPLINLEELSPNQREAEAQRQAKQEAQRPFNLAQGPLFRAKLLRLTAEEHILLLNMHHIISDGWSFDVSLRELTALYQAFANNKPSPLPKLAIQYADFALWQREWIQGEFLQSQLDYWRQQLSNELSVLHLPTDRPRPLVKTYQGSYQSLELSKDLTQALKALSQQEGVTLFMTLLAAFQTLLFRYCEQSDIVVGSAIAGRNQAETNGLIGFFVNTLVLRTDLSGNPSFRELLLRVREVALGAYAHQDLPFEQLLEELQPARDLSRSPVFEVMFVLQKALPDPLELPGLALTQLEIHNGTAKFDLTLDLQETAEGIRGRFEYSTDIFDAATIARMSAHFQILLAGIIADPAQHLSQLPLLTAVEQHQLLVDWNNTQTDYPTNSCIHHLFEEQVARTPNHVAVVFEDSLLTYRQLNAKANQLAHYLQSLGVRPEVLVGICVERSLEMVVGLLGILKAGGAYVPLDPAYPQERLAFMLQDIQAPVVLTQQHLVDNLPVGGAHLICLDTDKKVIDQENEENLEPEVMLDNLVYTIYTSGSTGKPKGIAMSHRCLSNLISWQIQHSTVDNAAKTLQFTSLSFDVSCQEIFVTWCSGGTLVLLCEELRRDAVGLLHFLTNQQVERVFLPFVALQQLAEVADSEGLIPTSLREIITAGEQLQITLQIANLFKQLKNCTLQNQYGPSESHVVTAFTLTGSVDSWSLFPPIGRPIANTQIYILDSHLQPVPIGVPGELYIGGAGLARGYVNRPDLTSEKFIPNPFHQSSNLERLYKTGDLARYLSDGNIEFLGRLDNQVKIRGFRIELGEIEAAIAQHPSIQQTVVTARVDDSGDKRLVGYIVPHPEQTPTTDELRSFLKQKLPEYMVPSTFVMLDALPLTPNGKVDRRALPLPEYTQQDAVASIIATQDELELQLTKIWEKVLGRQSISIKDNFFDLGGHSLLAVRLFAEIEKTFGKKLPLATLFQAATIAEIAEIIRQKNWIAPWSSLVTIQPYGSRPPLFYIHPVGGNVLIYRDLALSLGTDQPVYGLQARGLDGKYVPINNIEEMADYYIAQIRNIQPEGPYFLAGFSGGGLVAWEMAVRFINQGQKVSMLALFDTPGPGYPKPLPPIPRFFSVLNWVVFDFLNIPLTLAAKLKELGIEETRFRILAKLGIFNFLQDDDQIEKQLLETEIRSYIAGYKSNSHGSFLEKWLNFLAIFLLKNSSKSYYAKALAGGLYLDAINDLPEALQKVEQANREAGKSYVPPVYHGRVVFFRAINRPPGIYRDPQLGWSGMVEGGMEIYEVPGDHGSIMKSPVLAEKLKACLDQAQAES